jgi:hypothetical protein
MLGTAVVSGMLAATLLGVFIIPSLFVIVEKLAGWRSKSRAGAGDQGAPASATPGASISDPTRGPDAAHAE